MAEAAQDRPSLPVPLTRWFADPTNATTLREVINHGHFLIAKASLLDVVVPSISGMSPDPEKRAMMHAWLAGYRDAFRDLERLTVVAPKPEEDPHSNMLEEWGHVLPPSRVPSNHQDQK